MSEKMDNYVDCIVCVSGTYLQLDQDDKVLLTVRDVTRQKKILDELEEARRNAEWAGEQKTAFLANMSHEIRTPLNAIVGFAGLLGTASDQDRISYVEIIKGNTNMLLQLVNDILDISKIEAGTLEFIYTDVDVNQIMRELEGISDCVWKRRMFLYVSFLNLSCLSASFIRRRTVFHRLFPISCLMLLNILCKAV